jgi:hypothetical protein
MWMHRREFSKPPEGAHGVRVSLRERQNQGETPPASQLSKERNNLGGDEMRLILIILLILILLGGGFGLHGGLFLGNGGIYYGGGLGIALIVILVLFIL